MTAPLDTKQRAEELLERLDPVLRLFSNLPQDWERDNWPTGRCTIASLFAAPFLRAYLDRPGIRVILGKGHVWLEDDHNWIYDPTYQQFHKSWPTPWRVLRGDLDGDTSFYRQHFVMEITRETEDYYRDTIRADGTSELLNSKAFREAAFGQ